MLTTLSPRLTVTPSGRRISRPASQTCIRKTHRESVLYSRTSWNSRRQSSTFSAVLPMQRSSRHDPARELLAAMVSRRALFARSRNAWEQCGFRRNLRLADRVPVNRFQNDLDAERERHGENHAGYSKQHGPGEKAEYDQNGRDACRFAKDN